MKHSTRWTTAGRVLALFLLALMGTSAPAFAELLARQITAQNLHEMTPGGLDAIGGAGDWLLSNGTLCAVVSAPQHQAYLSLYGGTLVDLWHCDQANDQWVVLHEQRNLEKTGTSRPLEVTAKTEAGLAELMVRGELDNIETRTYYRLSPAAPTQLQVTYELRRTGPGDALKMLGLLSLHPEAALVPFTLNPDMPGYSPGASQPYIDTRDFSNLLAAISPSPIRVLAGAPSVEPAISYGMQVKARLRGEDGEEVPVQGFFIGSATFTNLGLFTEPFWLPSSDVPGTLSFLRGQLMDLDEGDALIVDLTMTVGDRADAASVTDQLYRGQSYRGRVDAGPAGITVEHPQGGVLTFVRTAADGSFSFTLPQGVDRFVLKLETPWGQLTGTYQEPPADLGVIATGAYTVVHLPEIGPASLVFKGEGDTPDPVIFNTLTGVSSGGERLYTGMESNRVNLAGRPGDVRSVTLAPGRYRVVATRGMEYGVSEALIEASPGKTVVLDLAAPPRAIESPGLVAADLHLHSGASLDSSISDRQRVVDFIAQGGEILVATEHNITVDLAAQVAELDLRDQLVPVGGVEITGMARSPAAPTTIGHSNVFPVPADPQRFRGGTLDFEGKRLGQVIGAYKEAYPDSVFQLNHPRANVHDDDLSFFNHLSKGEPFTPQIALGSPPNDSLLEELPGTRYRDIDFDAMELLNGKEQQEYLLNREDWFALLRQGHFKIGTANSDSHFSSQLAAIPRTYLAIDDKNLAGVTALDVSRALRSGQVYGTNGPLIDVRLGDAVPGQTFVGNAAQLNVAVRAASWVGVDELRVFVDGKQVIAQPIAAGETATLALSFDADSFVTVEVSGSVTAAYQDVAPGYSPLAFSNPIFVDSDGNGYSYNHNYNRE